MSESWERQSPYTLAQFARRAKIGEGRARALYGAKPSKLPKPDRVDVDGRPLWWPSTIDQWCARTGRKVSEDALWLFGAQAAEAPAVELQRGEESLLVRGHSRRVYVIVWDTPQGHVVYLQPLEGTPGHRDELARCAALLIEPRWWSSAVVIIPDEPELRSLLVHAKGAGEIAAPWADVYQIVPDAHGEVAGNRLLRGVQRWAGGRLEEWTADRLGVPVGGEPRASWEGQIGLEAVARVIGQRVPVWLYGTLTSSNARQTLSYNQTFTVPDTISEWPVIETRLTAAVDTGFADQFPAALAILAADARAEYQTLQDVHNNWLADTGPGWYLVCRPSRPAPPVRVEEVMMLDRSVPEPADVARELRELRAAEAQMTVEDPQGDLYAEAIQLLTWHLYMLPPEDLEHVRVADEALMRFEAPWRGPVIDAWRANLTEVTDIAAALRLRRVRRLLDPVGYTDDQVRAIYLDATGDPNIPERYLVVVDQKASRDYGWLIAEWPASLSSMKSWTDKTVIAGDEDEQQTVLLALTPTDDGRMHAAPVPTLPSGHAEGFAYGYGGGTPFTTYQVLLRCVLDTDAPKASMAAAAADGNSELWNVISTTKGPLRLPWPKVQLWARTDLKNGGMKVS